MHVLHVLDHSIPLQSGYTFRTRAILNEQRALGWKTTQVTGPKHNPGKSVPATEQVDGLEFYRCQGAESLLEKLPVLGQWSVISVLTKRLIEVARKEKPDVIHAHSPALNGVAAIRAGRALGLPVVYEIRGFWEDAAVSHGTSAEGGLRYRLTRAMETWVLKRADEVTCICEGIRQDLIARGIAPQKITIVPNAVDASRFQPVGDRNPEIEQRLNLTGKKVIAFIGSFYAYEGLDLLVAAMPRLLAARPDIRLLLVGGGQVTEEIKQQIAQLGLQDSVIMTGRVPYEEVEGYYSVTDVLVYPRKSMRLTDLVTPLKPLEAMAQKSMFLASDVGGHKELVRDGVTGTLFKADNLDDLVKSLLDLLDREESWPAIREAGRDFVENERNWVNSVANLKPVYQRLVPGENQ
ncbi:GDP-mannose-dependent alpha-(1-6)-phosphatidylinositol monomannoside mannosyltransferase [Halioglobus japonicus]|nr:GDP-mannose-dependent alpha-(1-6)-phosphatidylinositol monomannoside mannosyltransferase [Halioglobus japonicus]